MNSSRTLSVVCIGLIYLVALSPAGAQDDSKEPKSNSTATEAELKKWVDILDRGHWPDRDKARAKLRSNAIAATKSPQCKNPQRVASSLGFIGADNAKAAKVILASLDHKDPKIRVRLVGVFHYLRGKQPELVIPWIIKNLSDENDQVSLILVQAAAYHGAQGKLLVPVLVPLLNRENAKLKALVLRTLCRMTPHLGAHMLKIEALKKDESPEVRLEVFEIFHRLNPKLKDQLQLWRSVLKDPGAGNKRVACRRLAKLGGKAAVAGVEILALCKDKDPKVRGSAVYALGVIYEKRKDKASLVACFTEALSDGDLDVRENAAQALARMGPAAISAVPLLIKLLDAKESNGYMRYHLAQALGAIGEKTLSVPALQKLLTTQDSTLKKRVKKSLAQLGVKVGSLRVTKFHSKLAPLYLSLEVKGRYIHRDAILEVARQGLAIVPLLLEQLKILDLSMQRLIGKTLIQIGRADSKAVILIGNELKSSSFTRRLKIMELLIDLGPRAKVVLNEVVTATNDRDAQVRWQAFECLGNLGPESIPALIKLLGHSDVYRQRGSAKALAVVKGDSKDLRKALIGQLNHSDDAIRGYVAKSLGTKDSRAGDVIPALIKALSDAVAKNRIAVCQALKKQGAKAKTALPILQKLVLSDKVEKVQFNGIQAYAKISKGAGERAPFFAGLFLKTKKVKLRNELLAAMTIAAVPVKEILPCIKQAMTDWDSLDRRRLIGCLGRYAGASEDVLDILLGLLKHKEAQVRVDAINELKRLEKYSPKAIAAVEKCISDSEGWVRIAARSALEKLNEAKK
ncbi:MAG: HEAT repeat domain-containing protein [Planctomycetota bacterium]|nr:HEAT repeat domain-containing protein [Planctomycetota bacterium]